MKLSIVLAFFAAAVALARPSRHDEDDDRYSLDYNFTMRAFMMDKDNRDSRDTEKIGVREVGFNAPVIMGYNMLWSLQDGILFPSEHPDYKVDISLFRIYPPRVALLPLHYQSVPGYKVEVRKEHGEMMIRVARPILDQLGTFSGYNLQKEEPLVFLPFRQGEIGIMVEKQKDNQRYHRAKESDFLLQCSYP